MPADRISLHPRALRVLARAGALAAMLWLAPAHAVDAPSAGEIAPTVAADPRLEADVQELAHKLRCLVCQNQTVADSHAGLAEDLRRQVREMIAQGRRHLARRLIPIRRLFLQ